MTTEAQPQGQWTNTSEEKQKKSDKAFLNRQFRLLSSLNYAPKDPEAIEGWVMGAEIQLAKIGRSRFESAVKKILANWNDFPKPGEIFEQAPIPENTEWWAKYAQWEREFNAEAAAAGMKTDEYRMALAKEFSAKIKKTFQKIAREKSMK